MTALAGTLLRNIGKEYSAPVFFRGMSTIGVKSNFESENGQVKIEVAVESAPRPSNPMSGCSNDPWNRRVTIILKSTQEIDCQEVPSEEGVVVKNPEDYVLAQIKKIMEDTRARLLLEANKNHFNIKK